MREARICELRVFAMERLDRPLVDDEVGQAVELAVAEPARFGPQEAVVGDLAHLHGKFGLGLRRVERLVEQTAQRGERNTAIG